MMKLNMLIVMLFLVVGVSAIHVDIRQAKDAYYRSISTPVMFTSFYSEYMPYMSCNTVYLDRHDLYNSGVYTHHVVNHHELFMHNNLASTKSLDDYSNYCLKKVKTLS